MAVTACAGGDDPALDGVADPGAGTTAPAADDGAAPPPGGPGHGDGNGGTGPPGGPGGTSPGDVTPPPPATATTQAPPSAAGPPGSFAPALLAAEPGSRLVVEVLAEPGAAPIDRTVDHLLAVLGRESGRPVTATRGAVSGGGGPAWTAEEIRAAADRSALGEQRPDTVRMRLLFLAGGLDGNDTALGVAVRGDVAAVFTDRVEQAGAVLGTARLERAVAVHEAGHLLGLVDLYLRTGREDPEHPGHSRNEGSVMYWAVESTLVGQLLGAGPPTDFDAADRADLARIRSGT